MPARDESSALARKAALIEAFRHGIHRLTFATSTSVAATFMGRTAMNGDVAGVFLNNVHFLCYAVGGIVGSSLAMGFAPPTADGNLTARGNAIFRLACGFFFGIFCAPKLLDLAKLIPVLGFGDTLNDWLCVGFASGIGSWFIVGTGVRFWVRRQGKDALEIWNELNKKSSPSTPAVQDSKDGNDPVNH